MINRNYQIIGDIVSAKKSVLVLGPRGTGKTFYLSRLIKEYDNHILINLLDRKIYKDYLLNPSLIYNEVKANLTASNSHLVLMIDEVQLIPEILNEVHRTIEDFKDKVSFVLTGSSARKLKKSDANLLAGRALKIDFYPIGFDEIDIENDLDQFIKWGTLPETLSTQDRTIKELYLETYVGTYLEEEVKKEAQVRNIGGFARFLEVAARANGQCINYSKIARACGLNDVSVKQYFQILVDTLLAYNIPAWDYSIRKQLIKSPKFYFYDNGVICSLLGELSNKINTSSYLYGRLFESLVLTQMIQCKNKNRIKAKIYHYRDSAGKEIDFIVQKNEFAIPVAVEIKSAERPNIEDLTELVKFSKLYPKSKQVVICRTPRNYIEEGIEFLSFSSGIKRVFELTE